MEIVLCDVEEDSVVDEDSYCVVDDVSPVEEDDDSACTLLKVVCALLEEAVGVEKVSVDDENCDCKVEVVSSDVNELSLDEVSA